MSVIRFFAKKMDVRDSVADTILVVEPGLDEEATRLARIYGIRYREVAVCEDSQKQV